MSKAPSHPAARSEAGWRFPIDVASAVGVLVLGILLFSPHPAASGRGAGIAPIGAGSQSVPSHQGQVVAYDWAATTRVRR